MKILLLHGFLESQEIWAEIKKDLSTDYQVLTPDLLGHGTAETIAEIHTMEMMAEKLHSQLAENQEKNILVGHSMGGYVALAFAEMFPEKVSGIILMNSTTLPDSEEKKENRERVVKIIDKDKSFFVRNAITNLFGEKNKIIFEKEREKLIEIAMKTPNEGIKSASLGMKNRPDRTQILKSLEIPKHFIIGKNDALIPFETLIDVANQTNASYSLLDGGHLSYIENQADTISILRNFIEKVNK